MADAMDTLKNILGDDAEDKIKTVMNSLSSADNTSEGIDSSNGLNQIMQIKNIMLPCLQRPRRQRQRPRQRRRAPR